MKSNRPDEKPEQFQQINRAYKWAIKQAKSQAELTQDEVIDGNNSLLHEEDDSNRVIIEAEPYVTQNKRVETVFLEQEPSPDLSSSTKLAEPLTLDEEVMAQCEKLTEILESDRSISVAKLSFLYADPRLLDDEFLSKLTPEVFKLLAEYRIKISHEVIENISFSRSSRKPNKYAVNNKLELRDIDKIFQELDRYFNWSQETSSLALQLEPEIVKAGLSAFEHYKAKEQVAIRGGTVASKQESKLEKRQQKQSYNHVSKFKRISTFTIEFGLLVLLCICFINMFCITVQ